MVPSQELKWGVGPERKGQTGMGCLQGRGQGWARGRNVEQERGKKAKVKQRKCSGLFGGGCQAALALSNNVCSGTGNSQLMGTNFLADFRGHNKAEWFPSHPQPLLAPRADGVCAHSGSSPHTNTMGCSRLLCAMQTGLLRQCCRVSAWKDQAALGAGGEARAAKGGCCWQLHQDALGRCPGLSSAVGMDQPLLCCSFPAPPGTLQSPSHAVCPQPAHGHPAAAHGGFLCSALAWACSGETLGKEPRAPRPCPEASAVPQQCPWPVPAAALALPPPALAATPRALRPYSNTRGSRAAGQWHGSSTGNTKCCCSLAQLLCHP